MYHKTPGVFPCSFVIFIEKVHSSQAANKLNQHCVYRCQVVALLDVPAPLKEGHEMAIGPSGYCHTYPNRRDICHYRHYLIGSPSTLQQPSCCVPSHVTETLLPSTKQENLPFGTPNQVTTFHLFWGTDVWRVFVDVSGATMSPKCHPSLLLQLCAIKAVWLSTFCSASSTCQTNRRSR